MGLVWALAGVLPAPAAPQVPEQPAARLRALASLGGNLQVCASTSQSEIVVPSTVGADCGNETLLGPTRSTDPTPGAAPLDGVSLRLEGGTVCVPIPVVDDKCESWVAAYDNTGAGGGGADIATSVALSPEGERLFTTGGSWNGANFDFATVAYDAKTGQELWVSRYDGPAKSDDFAQAVLPSPDGQRVYVTGVQDVDFAGHGDFGTVAYDALSGEEVWTARFDRGGQESAPRFDFAYLMAVAPLGDRVYVAGRTPGEAADFDFSVVSYEASSGDQEWAATYRTEGTNDDIPQSMAISPDGSEVYVTGLGDLLVDENGFGSGSDFYTVALVAIDSEIPQREGQSIWESRYDGGVNGTDIAHSVRASPDGRRVYVTGAAEGAATDLSVANTSYATVAYDQQTGEQVWATSYDGPGTPQVGVSINEALSLAVSPDGRRLYVTGGSSLVALAFEFATVAYDASSGTELWDARYNLPGHRHARADVVLASPDGSRVYVTGQSGAVSQLTCLGSVCAPLYGNNFATLAYDSETGQTLWVARHQEKGSDPFFLLSAALSHTGNRLYVGGTFANLPHETSLLSNFEDYGVLAYDV